MPNVPGTPPLRPASSQSPSLGRGRNPNPNARDSAPLLWRGTRRYNSSLPCCPSGLQYTSMSLRPCPRRPRFSLRRLPSGQQHNRNQLQRLCCHRPLRPCPQSRCCHRLRCPCRQNFHEFRPQPRLLTIAAPPTIAEYPLHRPLRPPRSTHRISSFLDFQKLEIPALHFGPATGRPATPRAAQRRPAPPQGRPYGLFWTAPRTTESADASKGTAFSTSRLRSGRLTLHVGLGLRIPAAFNAQTSI